MHTHIFQKDKAPAASVHREYRKSIALKIDALAWLPQQRRELLCHPIPAPNKFHKVQINLQLFIIRSTLTNDIIKHQVPVKNSFIMTNV